MKRFRITWLFALLIAVLAVSASDSAVPPVDITRFPTMAALQQTTAPAADRIDLARRFFGLTTVPAPYTAPAPQLGDIQSFTITSTDSNSAEVVQADLLAIRQHVYVWVEQGSPVSKEVAAAFAERFDSTVYTSTRDLWGSEDNPGIDGDARIYALFSRRIDPDLAAYFASQNTYPRAVVPISNEHEMLIFNVFAYGGMINNDDFISAAAHEFQHMIRHHIDPDEQSWLNEGFSMLTEHLLGIDNNSWAYSPFLVNPGVQLNSWGTADDRSAEYGAEMLFVLYFYERYGADGLRLLSASPANGLQSVDEALWAMNEPGVEEFFADWVLANVLRDPAAGYGYRLLPANAASTSVTNVYARPYSVKWLLNQYATEYFAVLDPPGALTIALTMSDAAALIPVETAVGDWFWYSSHSDMSNPTLTRAFDLRYVDQATLRYRIWYELEENWDYAYISISTDDGQTWQPQHTDHTTTSNPNEKAYGVGFTGQSTRWYDDSLSLDAFVGQEILVRFEVVTDDSLNRAGVALDDMSLDTIGYSSDFNIDTGGWESAGWIRTDNRVPQRAWLQAVQHIGSQLHLTRWLAEGSGEFKLDVLPGTNRVTIALSPFAPVTLVPVDYMLVIE